MSYKSLLLSALVGLSACAQQPAAHAQQSAHAAASVPAKAAGIWIDVRTPEEFSQGHLQDALNIPVEQIGGKIAEVSPDKQTPIHLYCRSGRRAESALQTLHNLGYTQVINHGGYEDLIRKGLR